MADNPSSAGEPTAEPTARETSSTLNPHTIVEHHHTTTMESIIAEHTAVAEQSTIPELSSSAEHPATSESHSTAAEQSTAMGHTATTDQSTITGPPSTTLVPPPYAELRAHTAKCESCDKKNRGMGWQCTKCIVKFCQACVEQHGYEGLRRWHPPCFRGPEEGSKPRRRRKRARDSIDEEHKDTEASSSKPEQTEQSAEARSPKVPRLEEPTEPEKGSGIAGPAPGAMSSSKKIAEEVTEEGRKGTAACKRKQTEQPAEARATKAVKTGPPGEPVKSSGPYSVPSEAMSPSKKRARDVDDENLEDPYGTTNNTEQVGPPTETRPKKVPRLGQFDEPGKSSGKYPSPQLPSLPFVPPTTVPDPLTIRQYEEDMDAIRNRPNRIYWSRGRRIPPKNRFGRYTMFDFDTNIYLCKATPEVRLGFGESDAELENKYGYPADDYESEDSGVETETNLEDEYESEDSGDVVGTNLEDEHVYDGTEHRVMSESEDQYQSGDAEHQVEAKLEDQYDTEGIENDVSHIVDGEYDSDDNEDGVQTKLEDQSNFEEAGHDTQSAPPYNGAINHYPQGSEYPAPLASTQGPSYYPFANLAEATGAQLEGHASTPVDPEQVNQRSTPGLAEEEELRSLPRGCSTVVVSAGITGLCIAYQLGLENNRSGNFRSIVVLEHLSEEEGSDMCAGRLAASDRHKDDVSYDGLARGSLREWREICRDRNVAREVGYSRIPSENPPSWLGVQDEASIKAGLTNKNYYTALVSTSSSKLRNMLTRFRNPGRMMAWLKEECRGLGVQFIPAKYLLEITDDNYGKVTGVQYAYSNSGKAVGLACQDIIFALGESTETVLNELFGGNSRLRFDFVHECQDWMTMEDPWPQSEPRIYSADGDTGYGLDIVNRGDGTFWIGGPTMKCTRANPVGPNTNILSKVQKHVRKLLKGPPGGDGVFDGEVIDQERTFFVRTQSGNPIISRVPISYVDPYRVYGDSEPSRHGLILCAGYGEEGMALGMGMAKMVSDLVQGRPFDEEDTAAFGVDQYLVQ